jgi:hypothetical protein
MSILTGKNNGASVAKQCSAVLLKQFCRWEKKRNVSNTIIYRQ